MRSEKGGLPTARSKLAGNSVRAKSPAMMRAPGCSRRTMRAVTGSSSMPVTCETSRRPSGISAGNNPVPMPGSRTRPPRQPRRRKPAQIVRTINSGVKCAYWVQRASEAWSRSPTASCRSSPIASQPLRNPVSPGRRKTELASSEAPNPVKRISCACSSAVAARSSASMAVASRIAAMLSRARSFQPFARARSPDR